MCFLRGNTAGGLVFPVQAGISFRQFSVLRYSIKGSFTNDVFLSAAIDRLGRSRGFGSPAFLRVGGSVSQPCPTRRYTRHGGIPLSDAGSCHSRVLRCDVSVLFTGGIWNTAGRSIRTATTPGGVQLECLPRFLFSISRGIHILSYKKPFPHLERARRRGFTSQKYGDAFDAQGMQFNSINSTSSRSAKKATEKTRLRRRRTLDQSEAEEKTISVL